MDELTLQRIKQAHPILRDELRKEYEYCNQKLLGKYVRLRFAYAYRTNEEQHELSLKRPRVTNADGGQSIHNYGLAFDIVLLYDKDKNGTFETASWEQNEDWRKVAEYFKSKGWEWGGDWKTFKDRPHFQKAFGFSWKSLKQRVDNNITIIDGGITYPKI